MNLPRIITDLVKSQHLFDSHAYANCFADTATVLDEGKTYKGKTEIKSWIEKANHDYRITMIPMEYLENEQTLRATISGTFPGSPIVLNYHFEIDNHLIQSLKID